MRKADGLVAIRKSATAQDIFVAIKGRDNELTRLFRQLTVPAHGTKSGPRTLAGKCGPAVGNGHEKNKAKNQHDATCAYEQPNSHLIPFLSYDA
ncbi:hypothetical protein Q4578_04775 [Shimia thalassica]|nr:hypothetical protein [Shimia thalassica]